MISALLKSAKGIVFHPLSLVPALVFGAIIAIAFFLVLEQFFDLIINIVFLEQVPDTGIAAFPFQFFSLYAGNLIPLLLAFFASAILIVLANFFYANYAKELLGKKASIGKAFSKTIGQAGKAIGLLVFFGILALFILAIFWFLAVAIETIGIIALILTLVFAILAFYFIIKISFTIPILAIEEEKIKTAIGKSWEFSSKRFWQVLLFLIIVAIISAIIIEIGSALSDAVIDDLLSIIVFAIFWAIAMAFSGFAMANYYLEKQ